MHILSFGASYSRNSINQSLASFAAQRTGLPVIIRKLSDWDMPIYNIDLERESGFPSQAVEFVEEVERAEAIIISFAEHNGMYTAAFKNILDWASRINRNMWNNKSLLFLSTSTGKRGAVTVLNLAVEHFHRMGASKIESFSLPLYYSNFDSQEGIIDQELSHKFDISLKNFINTITQEARRTDRQIEQSV